MFDLIVVIVIKGGSGVDKHLEIESDLVLVR